MNYDAPGLLIVTDSEEGAARGRDAAVAAGARVLAVLPIEGAVAALGERHCDALLIDAGHASEPLERLLDEVADRPVILVVAADMIDLGWSAAPEAALLSAPTPAELAAALHALLAPVSPHVAERRDHPAALLQLSAEVGRIAQALADLGAVRAEAAPDAGHVRAILRARRLRDRFFDPGLFADPAWDMMLDLYAARIEAKRVAVSSLCIAAAVPNTTALRWIRSLTDAGILVRVADPEDGRRFFIALADLVADALGAYFAELQRQGLPGA